MRERPLSVVERDQDALASIFATHAPNARRVVDCTYSKGTMWKGWQPPFTVIRSDLSAQPGLDVRADFIMLPFRDLDALVFDPPHIADGGATGLMAQRYASVDLALILHGFVLSASEVLAPGGLLVSKIADGIHSNRYQWHHRTMLDACDDYGLENIDCVIRVRKAVVNDPKWKRVLHVRRAHAYWLVARKS